MEEKFKLDDDLINYISSKENANTFINFCIRERMNAEIRLAMRPFRPPSVADRESKHYDRSTLDPLDSEKVENKDTPFFQKKIVITGQFYAFPERNELGSLLRKYGADMNTAISRKTDIVVIGYQAGPKKKEQIKDLCGQGYNIITYNETQLLSEFDKYNIPYNKI